MAQVVLVASSKVIPRRTLQILSICRVKNMRPRKESVPSSMISYLKKLGYYIRTPEKQIKDYVPYSDDVDPDSVNLCNGNDPINKDGTSGPVLIWYHIIHLIRVG